MLLETCLIVFLSLQCYCVDSAATLVSTNILQGKVVGNATLDAGIFWGIPFSQPPVGEYRWQRPRKPLRFRSTHWDATFKRDACIQTHTPTNLNMRKSIVTSEDCLYLNVFVPRKLLVQVYRSSRYIIPNKYKRADTNSLAVMVFIHGGNFNTGAGSFITYDARVLANRGDVVVVTINYRLGPLGFLVQGEGKDAAVGNYGIWDQLMALKWVKNNIKYFGGNPDKVTIFGESAGGQSVGLLLTSKYGNDLYRSSILESDPLSLTFRDLDGAKKIGNKFADDLGCKSGGIACLKKVSTDKIQEASKTNYFSVFRKQPLSEIAQRFGPVIDGDLLTLNPMDAFKRGRFNKVPTIIGGNVGEGYTFVKQYWNKGISDFFYKLPINLLFKSKADAILKEYPPQCQATKKPNCDNKKILIKFLSEYLFLCPERAAIRSIGTNAWFYIFNATMPVPDYWRLPGCVRVSCHESELPYVFYPPGVTDGFNIPRADIALSRRMQYYWTNFAKYGNPNGKQNNYKVGAISWNQFSTGTGGSYEAIYFSSNGDKMLQNPYKEKCDFLDSLNLYAKL